ncbi:patatin-like phospholipase family protein [Pseudomonas sp. P9_31]|uniref:patatin-like phospholipase family protein n=1 Tax=Pseudomonas sp. P9_31 TaxID=3043448 RepID=UPI002A36B273|nr:patatin-like phospholipase family protein [Pseudomonas sp. P9_31]WPN55367.1 patatin-like phospholipase family protein [Pseudomonas sp. P9_31]
MAESPFIEPTTKRFSLALSGGGVRAMVFHLGVLDFLAKKQMLEDITHISTVSGGSLLVGLIMQEAGWKWPSSAVFLSSVYPSIRAKMCSRSLLFSALRQLRSPLNFRFLLSRANLLSLGLQNEWGVNAKLSDIPPSPEWSINGTTAENGKRFRFKYDSIGDFSIGYADPENFPLSGALAVSAAFPGGIGPYSLKTRNFTWLTRPWNAPLSANRVTTPVFRKLRLYDGGVYDNLGLEPLFDAGRGIPKHGQQAILVSDAGAPLSMGFSAGLLSPWRLMRIADIMSEQSRALRVRTFVDYLKNGPGRGAYLGIASPLINPALNAAAEFSCRFPTTLRRLKASEFELLAGHGYALTEKIEQTYGLL